MAPSDAHPEDNPGLKLCVVLRSKDLIGRIAWSPDGHFLAAALSYNKAVSLWDTLTGVECPPFLGHSRPVTCVAWSPDGQWLASGAEDTTMRIWDATTQQTGITIEGHAAGVRSLAWSPDGQTLASGSKDSTVRLWQAATGQVQQILEGHERAVNSVVWSPDGRLLASGAEDAAIRIWETSEGQSKRVLAGHSNTILSLAWSPDGQILASASADKTIGIWDVETGRLLYLLEGHTGVVTSVSFSADGRLLASKDTDGMVRIWRTDIWETVALLSVSSSGYRFASLSFHPSAALLAIPGERDLCLHVWDMNHTLLLGMQRGETLQAAFSSGTSDVTRVEGADVTIERVEQDSRSYANARVVLLGDSGVGKTALSLVLTGQPYGATDSTYGRHVWPFDRDESEPKKTRETLLWDLAGQPGFRLIHQLYLTDIAVAVVVFDARSETDPFAGVRYWDRALCQAQIVAGAAAIPMKKFLVAARTDRGGIPVHRKQIDTLMRRLGFDRYFETSAREGSGIQDLADAIRAAIDWHALPSIRSNDLFQQIKDFLIAEKQTGRELLTEDELYRGFLGAGRVPVESADLRDQFSTCIGLVESRDLVRRLSFGNLVLLRPELLDAYAAALIMAVRNDPDGMGCIAENSVRTGQFPIPTDVRITDKQEEKLLLIATVEDLLRHEIALREPEGSWLIFPSQLTFEREDAPAPDGHAVLFTFEGAVPNIYATLAVRLAHSGQFRRQKMWKNMITYTAQLGGVCGISLAEGEEGRAELTLFFDQDVTEETRFTFDEYVYTHLQRRALPDKTRRRRIFACPACATIVTDQVVTKRREREFNWVNCPVCETRISLLDGADRVKAERAGLIHAMDSAANAQRERETAKSMLAGKRATNDFDVFLCYDPSDEQVVRKIDAQLLERGIWPWLAGRQQRSGVRWQHLLEQDMNQIKTVAVFVGKSLKVPWANLEIESFLRTFILRRQPVILVVLPDVSEEPLLPKFLNTISWVDFRKQETAPLDEFIGGITGERVLPTYTSPGWRPYVRTILVRYLNTSDVRNLCFDLGIDDEHLPGDTTEGKVRELIIHCEKHSRMADLMSRLRKLRPDLAKKLPANLSDYD